MGTSLDGGNTQEGYTVCPRLIETDKSLKLESRDHANATKRWWREISGLAASPTQRSPTSSAPVVFGIADGGKGAVVGVWDSGTGERLRSLLLPNRTAYANRDWESATIGPCGVDATTTCLYVADVGDNTARASGGRRSNRDHDVDPYRVLRILEPDLTALADMDTIPESNLDVLTFRYDQRSEWPYDGPYNDCEAMFVDHVGWGGPDERVGDLYLVTKWPNVVGRARASVPGSGRTRLFRIPVAVWGTNSSSPYLARPVGDYEGYDHHPLADLDRVTAASTSFDGTVIALGTVVNTTLYLRCPGATVAETLAAPDSAHCLRYPNPSRGQGEALTWMPGDRAVLNVPEGKDRRMGYAIYDYDARRTTRACPIVRYANATDDTNRNATTNETTTVYCVDDDGKRYPFAWCDALADRAPLPPLATISVAPSPSPTTTTTTMTTVRPTTASNSTTMTMTTTTTTIRPATSTSSTTTVAPTIDPTISTATTTEPSMTTTDIPTKKPTTWPSSSTVLFHSTTTTGPDGVPRYSNDVANARTLPTTPTFSPKRLTRPPVFTFVHYAGLEEDAATTPKIDPSSEVADGDVSVAAAAAAGRTVLSSILLLSTAATLWTTTR